MVGSLRFQRRRRGFAATACVLWLLGVEVLPNLHLAGHEADHSHGLAGEIVVGHVVIDDHSHADGAAHEHTDAHHSELASDPTPEVVEPPPAPRRKPRRDQLAIDDLGHHAGGLAHRQAALHRPAPPLLAPLPVVRTATWRIDAPTDRPSFAPLARPTARGPPIA